GDIWAREVLDNKTRQLISLAGFAAQGTMSQFKVHAQYALNYGATPEELMEVIYITTVTSGYPRALIAAGTLKELFQENNIKFPVTSQK
ncbi:MAG: carboxymuconolactone decarboxylase family protein, partial [Microcoleus sp. T1-bin1]|nr:carboxymuconolactone decarboxylase family protein [Microcoleus sp. T1-bin1]